MTQARPKQARLTEAPLNQARLNHARAQRVAHSRRSQQGFTLLEMLVALVAGAMTIATVYTLGAGSSRAFREQNRINQTQAAVRTAMEQVRRDVTRAGFGATPNSVVDNGANPAGCAVTQGGPDLQGVQVTHGAYTAEIVQAGDNVVEADSLVMTGNYATGDHYLVSEITSGTTITLQQSRQSFRRSFGSPLVAQRFADAFRVGRMVYLVAETGRRVARTITAVNGAAGSITVTPSISVGCFGYGRGARISPISRVEYFAVAPAAGGAFEWLLPRGDANAQQARGVQQTLLARRELTFAAGINPVANTERVVMEYLVHFNVSATMDTRVATVPTPNLVETLTGDGGAADLNARPERARALRVQLSARTPGADPNFPWAGPRANAQAPLTTFLPRLPPSMGANQAVGVAPAAHVRSAEEVITLDNIANRGLPVPP